MKSFLRSLARHAVVAAALSGGLIPDACPAADNADEQAAKAAEKAAQAAKQSAAAVKKKTAKWELMDYGPYLSASIISDPRSKFDNGPGSFTGDSTARGFAIKLSDDWADGVVFDSDLMRMSAGWLDGGLKLVGLIADGAHGPGPTVANPPLFQTPHLPGWADAKGSFADPRTDSIPPLPPPGPLPREQARYNGLYRHGDKVVLSYTINGAPILESPSVEKSGDAKALVRTIRIEKSNGPLSLMIADVNPQYPYPTAKKIENVEKKPDGYKPAAKVEGNTATLDHLNVALAGAPDGAKLEVVNGSQLVARIPQVGAPVTFKVLIARASAKDGSGERDLAKASPKPADLVAMTKGGPPLWKQTVETAGALGAISGPYVVDTITLPNDNPYNAWMRVGGFDFFEGGTTAALCTWSGDVWVVSGVDRDLDKLTWKRFATGLHQPLGLKVVDGKVYTIGHDQITRLHDLDNDGEADFYENFNSDWELTTAFHAFAFDLHTDKAGNFYFMFGSPVHAGGGGFQKITSHHGTALKVSKDGRKLEVVATGFRAPNGMGLNAETGQLTSGDNEGTWVPTCPIHWIKPGSFNGVVDAAHRPMKSTGNNPDPAEQPKPLCWLPKSVDNSGGGQVWVTGDNWGPFKGDLLHASYGTSSLYKVMYEEVNGQVQGGVVKLPVKFTSTPMRLRFNPTDGHLYAAGLKGWQTNAAKDGGFDRVRYTGQPAHLPDDLRVNDTGVTITFTAPLDPKSAADAENYDVEVWNYLWTGGYGSPEVSTVEGAPKGKKAHDPLTVKSARLLPDGKSVFLEIEGIKPVMQMKISYNIDAKDKPGLKGEIYNTIHNLGGPAPVSGAGQK